MIDNVIQVTTTSSHVRIYCCNNSDNRRDKCLVTLSSENSLVILAINKFHLHCTLLDSPHNASRAQSTPCSSVYFASDILKRIVIQPAPGNVCHYLWSYWLLLPASDEMMPNLTLFTFQFELFSVFL